MSNSEMNDAALDHAIAEALAVDPSPTFVARVRRRVDAAEHVSNVGAWPWAAVTISAALVVVLTSGALWHGRPATRSMPVLHGSAILPANLLSVAPGARTLGLSRTLTPSSAQAERRVGPKATAEPEILIDPREARTMSRLIDGVVNGRLDLTSLLDQPPPPVMDAAPIRDIYIAPIDVSALTDKGVPQ